MDNVQNYDSYRIMLFLCIPNDSLVMVIMHIMVIPVIN
jgi:hypothetical protein